MHAPLFSLFSSFWHHYSTALCFFVLYLLLDIFQPMEWLEQLELILLDWGYLGMFISALLAATILPFSSDAVLMGLVAAGCSPVWIVATATFGNWMGGLISYWMGWLGKTEWLERYFRVKHETIVKHKGLVDRWGSLLALISWVPFVGDVFAIVLGFYKAKFWPTAWWLLVGKCLRYICEALLIYYVV